MIAPDMVSPSGLMEDAKCFAFVGQHRWLVDDLTGSVLAGHHQP